MDYLTKDGDTVDFICWKHYGSTENRIVEQLLEKNTGLSDHGAILPAGIIIKLPAIDVAKKTKAIKLWD